MANVIDDINNNNKKNLNNQNLNSSKTINSNNNNDQNTNKLNNATINSLMMDSNIIQTNASTISTTSPTIMSTNVKRIRRYNILPGRNRFFCDGRIIMAKQISVFYFTVTLLISTCVSFFIFDSPYLSNKISPLVPIVAACLFLFVLFNLFRTSFTDPGILPRATPAEAADVEQQIVPNSNNASTMRPPPRTKEVMINNQIIKLKYCFTCKIFRPPRASHCSLCDNCVERFDHHCPWVGNCVGKRNYRFFYMFILSLAFLCIYIFSCIITHLILLSKTMTFVEAIKQSPVSVIEMIICFFSVWSILGLAGFHTYLIMSNLTTNEDIKGSFSKRNHVKVKNPYSKGSIFRNCFSILCSPIGPSLIHRRQYIYCEEKILTSSSPGSTSNVSNNKNIKSQQSQSLRFPNQAPTLYQPFQANAAAFMANDIHPTSMMPTTTPTSSCYQQQIASNNNESPQVISHQMKQSQPLNGCQSQYYVPIMKTPKQSQQFHHHPHHYADAHEQVYIGQDVDEIDKNQRYLAAQQQKSQMNNNNAAADNTVIFMPNDGAKMIDQSMQQHHHHHVHPHHYQQSQQQHHPSCQQACYYRKTSSSSSPSIRNNSAMKTATATPKSMDDAHNQAILMDQNYYTNLIRKNSSTMIIDDEQQNDYCNFRPIQSQQMAQSCSHTHSNQQQQQQPHYQTSNITNPLDNNNKMTYQQASFQQQQQQQQPRIANKLSKNVQTSTNNHQTMKQMNKSFN